MNWRLDRVVPYDQLALGLILLTTTAVYHGVWSNQWVLDDKHTVVYNASIESLTRAPEWFASPYAVSAIREYVNYRPVLMASYAIDRAVWGVSSGGFHAMNLTIHLGVVALVFVLGRRLTKDSLAAVCAAAAFALHPINAEAVNYVTARSSSLMTLFVLGAVWAVERAEGRHARAWRVAALLFGAAALGTKEAAVVLPVLVIVWRRGTCGATESWGVSLRSAVPFVVLTGCYLGARTWMLWGLAEPAVSGPGATLWQHVLFASKIYVASLGHWLWPANLAVDHAWPIWVGPGEGMLILGGLLVAITTTIALVRRDAPLGWGGAWFWIGILPAGALGFVTRLFLYQDNRTYLAGVGLAWVAGLLAAKVIRVSRAVPWLQWMVAAGAVVLIGSAAKADVARTAAWSNPEALWDDVLVKFPSSLAAHNGKGLLAFEAGRFEDARNWFQRAVQLSAGFAEGQKNLGIAHARLGEWAPAIHALETALSINPRHVEARLNLGKVYEHIGRPALALEAYEQVLREDPTQRDVELRVARLVEDLGRLPEASGGDGGAVVTGWSDDQALFEHGVRLLSAGRWNEAEEVFTTLTSRDPSSYDARFNLAAALDGRGAWDQAIEQYRMAAALHATDPDPLFRIGVLYSKQARWQEAAAAYGQVLAGHPHHVPTHLNLAIMSERLGDVKRAIGHYEAVLRTAGSTQSDDETLRERARQALAELTALSRHGERER